MPLTAAALQQALSGERRCRRPAPGTRIPPAGRSAAPAAQAAATAASASSAAIQQSITRIQDACQAPPLAPHEYRLLFEVMAKEISDNDLIGAQTLANITQRAQERGLEVRRDDVRFVLEVVSEADPWFEQGASANLFAGRFRNFVVARCRGQGLNLSADELDLIDAWFAGGSLRSRRRRKRRLPHRPTPPKPAICGRRHPHGSESPAPRHPPASPAGGPPATAAQGGAGDPPGSRGDPVARRSRRFPPHRPHPAAQLANRRLGCRSGSVSVEP